MINLIWYECNIRFLLIPLVELDNLYLMSPNIGCPSAYNCFLSWCFRPVIGFNSTKLASEFLSKTLKEYKIETFSDKDNIGIWHKKNNSINKVAAIGVRVKKWIAYHGLAININNNLEQYKKIIPCGIADKGVTNLISISNNDYSNLEKSLVEKFISNLKT